MISAAAERGWLDRERTILESLTGIRRAGADIVLTYWATEAAGLAGPLTVTDHARSDAERRPRSRRPRRSPDAPGWSRPPSCCGPCSVSLMFGTALLFGLGSRSARRPRHGPAAWSPRWWCWPRAASARSSRRAGPRRGSRRARTGLTAVGVVLAAVGLVQVTFLGVGGAWFVAFVAGAVLLHLPAARAWFGRFR